ncbi:MAG: NADH-quinone oxidoreductase subunit N [Tumebacillaceae bacterium]
MNTTATNASAFSSLTFTSIWNVMAPEMILIAFGFLILVVDLFVGKQTTRRLSPFLGIVALLAALGMVIRNFFVIADKGPDQLSNMLIMLDDYGNVFKLIFVVGTLLVLIMSIDFFKQNVEVKVAEYTYILLFATVGAMVMASAYDLITLFVGLELLSISSYVLVAIRRNHAKGAEGAMKYLVIGAIASAVALYGMSFIYGVTGQTNIATAAQQIMQSWTDMKPMLMLGFMLMLVGFGVKVSLVPFHQWAPDTYEGAPNPITSFLAVVSKAAGFAMLIRVFLFGFAPEIQDWYKYLMILSAVTMVVGNVAALTQKNIKRMLAYSSVAQAGYLLIPLAVLGKGTSNNNIWLTLGETVFYLAGYLFMTMGAFAALTAVTRETGSESIDSFRGLYRKAPFQAVAFAVFILSMAGMPLTAGFFGKFYIFLGAINTGVYWLAALLFFTSAIAFYYYFGVLKAIFAKDTAAEVTAKVPMHWSLAVVVWIGLIGTIGLGVFPNLFLNVLNTLKWFG